MHDPNIPQVPLDQPAEEAPPARRLVFKVGARVVIDGAPFLIRKITKKDLVLRPEK